MLVALRLAMLGTPLLTVTVIGPVVAFEGTVAVNEVDVAEFTVADAPLNETALLDSVVPSKFVPLIVTIVPTGPMVGVKLEIVGGGTVTVNPALLVTLPAGVETRIFPLYALGTVTVSEVGVTAVTVAERLRVTPSELANATELLGDG